MKTICLIVALVSGSSIAASQAEPSAALKPGAKVFVHEMPDDFDTYFKTALAKKKARRCGRHQRPGGVRD
jgi:hypothetical protein